MHNAADIFTATEWALIVGGYLLGCCTAGYYWVRWRTGQDIRHLGSGTVGARNVGRILGAGGFLITLLADLAKGALAVGAAIFFGLRPEAQVAVIVAVVVGHNWPVQLRFHGGKGVATSIGALTAYDPFITIILVAAFLPGCALLRNFTLSGLLAFTLSPLAIFFCGLGNEEVATVSFLAILVLITHRKNIREEFARVLHGRAIKEPARQPRKGTAS